MSFFETAIILHELRGWHFCLRQSGTFSSFVRHFSPGGAKNDAQKM
jgi:hypothetical protein